MKITKKMKPRLPVSLDRGLCEMSFLFAFSFRSEIGCSVKTGKGLLES